jgi:choline dehydrogenase-like flavoprotein
MFIDLNRVDRTHFRDRTFDVCVCGAGVAGITLARKLGAGLSVALLEGGGREYSYESQSLYRGRNIGLEYFDLAGTRLRYFGGTSNHWSGWMRPLDAHDFDARPDLDRPGWPIGQADLAPYLEEAKTTLGVSEARVVGSDATAAPLPGRVEGFHEVRFWINPIRFGERYAKDIESSTRIACYLHANVTDMRLDGNRVVHVAATNYAGKTFPVRARAFVLALGGIENPRILLNCNKQRPGGLGNQHGLVGRFFSEHPHLAAGAYLLEDGVPLSRTRIFSPDPDVMRAERMLNFGLRCMPRADPPAGGFKARLRRAICHRDWLEEAANSMRPTPVACDDGLLKIAGEQITNPDSRITLSEEVDALGLRQTVLNWQMTRVDKHSMRQALFLFGERFARAGLGRIRLARWLLTDDVEFPGIEQELAGHHHMCTTRMAASPGQGVVDANQKVFDIDNLYLAGSSVFTSGGHSNPTFTIVQMALRLADHLKRVHPGPLPRGSTAARPARAESTTGRSVPPSHAAG